MPGIIYSIFQLLNVNIFTTYTYNCIYYSVHGKNIKSSLKFPHSDGDTTELSVFIAADILSIS